MKDMLNIMGKFLAMGMSVDDVISGPPGIRRARSTMRNSETYQWDAPADIAVLSVDKGSFGLYRYVRGANGWHATAGVPDDD